MSILLWSILIFIGMLVVISFGTIRLVLSVKGSRVLAPILGFLEATIFITVIAKVIQNVTNYYMVLAYGIGFAVGIYVGIVISDRISRDLFSSNIISKKYSNEI